MRILGALLLLLASHGPVAADEPFQRELELVYVFEGAQPEYVFVIGQSGFRTVAALKEHLQTWPAGSELTWAPGCVRFGNEPLLFAEADMRDFQDFLASRGITFVLVPSG